MKLETPSNAVSLIKKPDPENSPLRSPFTKAAVIPSSFFASAMNSGLAEIVSVSRAIPATASDVVIPNLYSVTFPNWSKEGIYLYGYE